MRYGEETTSSAKPSASEPSERGEPAAVHAAEKQDRQRRPPRSPRTRRSPARAAAARTRAASPPSIGSRPRLKLCSTRVLAHRVVGGVEHHRELHQLRGLEVRDPERRASGARRSPRARSPGSAPARAARRRRRTATAPPAARRASAPGTPCEPPPRPRSPGTRRGARGRTPRSPPVKRALSAVAIDAE